ncbi:MAG: DNA methyltransferase [Bacteroidetes bacterium]|nr:MAG: DNA methyltransferase [Bacteroidota bacterium]
MTLDEYIKTIGTRYKTGISTEHSYRGDLQSLLESILPGVLVTNEPSRVACGAPDYILTKKNIPLGYIEAKDLGADLDNKSYKEQFNRYKASLSNIVFTNYLDFHFYRDGELLFKIELASIDGKKVNPSPQNFESFTDHIKSFATQTGQTIKSPKKLAEMMAAKAKLLAEVIEKSLTKPIDPEHPEAQEPGDNTLQDQLKAFQQILIHDIDAKEFADIYAQTLAYGMFAARLHDPNLDTFSRQEAAELIPKSNPFLRKLFQYIAGYDLDNRIKWIVDDLADIFRATDVNALLHDFGKSTLQTDPIIHFYETFLAAYDPKLRKARGVWYPPEPVVNFIVRAVDDILKSEFDLKDGLADTSKTKIKVLVNGKKVEKEVHKVQILDPATGTGTFLAEVIKQVHLKFEGQKGIWNNYVEDHLIPRLNGFEILMASYAMAHLKLDLLLTETGFKAKKDQRLRVYLTNSLEEHHPETGTLFASWLSNEANEANHIKRDTPVMVVLGNTPYSGESSNKGDWIMKLMEDYKKEPGGKEKLKERNPKWLNDDYVKFLRYGQHFIEKNGSGILAFINPHGYLDNPTFRGLRWNLLKTYNKIYTIDLHGNSKKKETTPDGSSDENIFDIMQGVSINVFVKTNKKKKNELGIVYHFDLFGKREMKYDFLLKESTETINFKEVTNISPNYFFSGKDLKGQNKYNEGFSINELFTINSAGIVTARDEFTIHFSKDAAQNKIEEFIELDDETARRRNTLGKDVRDWSVASARKDLINSGLDYSNIVKITYRPFEERYTYYTGTVSSPKIRPIKSREI